MNIKNEADAADFIKSLVGKSIKAQHIQLNKVIESLELNQMYYDQKGSERGVARTEKCLIILNNYYASLQID